MKRLLIAISVAALAAGAIGAPVAAREPSRNASHTDYRPGPLAQKQAEAKQRALELVISGQATPKGKNKVVKLAPGQYVELAFEGEDQILTLLGEFGTEQATHNHGAPPTGFGTIAHGGTPGPLHNEIPEPDRSVDNSTIWTEDFSQSHYDTLLYDKGEVPSMANYYLAQSSGAYSVDGYVSDWVQVPYNGAAYGSNYCGDIVCSRDVGRFLVDQANAWYAEMASTMTAAQIDAFLAPFDVWDRYDYDGDGIFAENDGYIDHFQSVHAGEGEETGGGALGEDAIWSHRSFANAGFGGQGPTVNGNVIAFGGLPIGNSSYWIGDYTIEPENGGVGVFAHEFAHDLNLPDLYDTSGNTGGAENSTGWWTIMSQGSYGSVNGEDIGSYPTDFGAWEKFQLGFLKNYAVGFAGQADTFRLGPAEFNNKQAQAAFIVLPNKEVPLALGSAFEGSSFYWSDLGDEIDHSMTKSVTLPASGDLTLDAMVRYDIETDWDYAYLTVDGDPVHTNRSTNTDPNGQNFGEGITGHTGGAWVALTADLTAFAGQTVEIGFRYWTDVAVVEPGFMVDALQIPGLPLDGAESDAGWTFDGFRITTGSEIQTFFNAYVLENRQYIRYDEALQKGPYNFGFPATPNYVEHFSLQDGLLISYWDNSQHDNNVGDHPGEGLILPVDSHPAIEVWSEGTQMRPRIQSYDSTFTLAATEAVTLHNPATGVAKTITSKPGTRVFNDALRDGDGTSIYWTPGHSSDAPGTARYQAEWNSVNVPDTGTRVQVKSLSSTGIMVVDINK